MGRNRQRKVPANDRNRSSGGVAPSRIAAVDALRGLAIVAMIVYHFAFDLRYFNVTRSDFENDLFWLTARAAIVASFLALAGISLVLADRAAVPTARFARRVAVIAACALAASVGSYFLFPRTYITFGILHCIAVSLVLARPLVRRPGLALGLGAAVIVAGLTLALPAFDTRALSWIGFTTVKPPTEDYVSLFPWLGVMLAGIAAGHALLRASFAPVAFLQNAPAALRWLGRHSLLAYMIHQPILIGVLWILLRR